MMMSHLLNILYPLKLLCLVLFPSETATLGQSGPATSWLTQNCGTSSTNNNSLGMAENSCDSVASRAFDIHEVTVRMLDQSL